MSANRAYPAGVEVEDLRVKITPPANNSIRGRAVMCFYLLSVGLGMWVHIDLFLTRLGGSFLISLCKFFKSFFAAVLVATIGAKSLAAYPLLKYGKFLVMFGAVRAIGRAVRLLQSAVCVPFTSVFKCQFIKLLFSFNFLFFGAFVGEVIFNQISNNGDRQCYC